jgi:hypothetical protein
MRAYRRLELRLKKADRDQLNGMLSRGVQPVRTVLRALALQQLDRGKSVAEVASIVPLTSKALREIGRRYEASGLEGSSLRQAAPWCGDTPGAGGTKANHRDGLQRSAGGPSSLDGAAGGRRGGEATPGSESGQRNHPAAASPRRSQAVAGKKCGTCRS